MGPEQEATNLLGMLPQHHRTKPACYLVRGLSAVDLCTLDTSLNANSFDPDTQDRLADHGVDAGGDAGGAGVEYQVEYHETQGSLAQERCLMAVSFLCKRNLYNNDRVGSDSRAQRGNPGRRSVCSLIQLVKVWHLGVTCALQNVIGERKRQ